MKYQLCILKNDAAKDWSDGQQRLRFAVVNLEKNKTYPMNFVCLLPLRVNSNFKTSFEQHFGAESVAVARQLLTDALKSAEDEDVRAEIERRLKLLEPEQSRQRTCAICGGFFQSRKGGSKQKYCENCLKKRFGDRT